MGPTNIALVRLFNADQQLREAQGRLDATSRSVRIQERKVNDLAEKQRLAQAKHRELQSKSAQLELDLKTRDAHIDKLRAQQQTANTNKEYQTFLVEINTQKVDRAKVEEETMRAMEAVEKAGAEAGSLAQQVEAERAKLATMSAQIGDAVAKLQAEVDALRPAREAAAAAVPPRARQEFERLADRYEGESMSALARPDRRREEYLCTACNMDLVADVYNKLHSRDEIVFCPSCRRMLFIPEDLPPEAAVGMAAAKAASKSEGGTEPKAPRAPRAKSDKPRATRASGAAAKAALASTEPRAKGELGEMLTAAQGESVRAAVKLGFTPVECAVTIDGKLAGYYKAQDPGHLERIIRFRMNEIGMPGSIDVAPRAKAEETPAAPDTAPAPAAGEASPAAPAAEPASNPAAPVADAGAPATTGMVAAESSDPAASESDAQPTEQTSTSASPAEG
jgi:uncharacterized protein